MTDIESNMQAMANEETSTLEKSIALKVEDGDDNSANLEERNPDEAVGYFTKKVGLISPDLGFFVNREALEDNKFIKTEFITMEEEESTFQAQMAFDRYVEQLHDNGVSTEIFHQSTKAADSIFPDWFTTARNPTLPNGVLIISSMKNHERRKERMHNTIDELFKRYENIIDLSFYENEDKFLELKGALVTDWENDKIYCNISDRAHEEVFDFMIGVLNGIASKTGDRTIRGIKFRGFDKNNESIYHTDCMMTLLNKHAVLCVGAIKDEEEKEMVIKELTDPELNVNPKEIITISYDEAENMCANMFNVLDCNNNHCVVMSKRANDNFEEKNLEIINENYKVIVADIDIIENIGGGSAR